MARETVSLPWGNETLSLRLPEGWRVLAVLQPASLPAVPDAAAEVRRSLNEPIGSPGLSQLVRPGMRVALVVDDVSRPTPVSLLAAPVLAELEAAGIPRAAITVVPALGLHRPLSEDELARRLGPDSFAGLAWANHDCDDASSLTNLGVTARGTPVLVNSLVAGADLVVSIGCIEPHIIAGFGGGYKNIIPGVAGRATVAANHGLNCRPDTFNNVGQPIERNPMRLDLEEAGRMLVPPVFVVNAVINARQEIVRMVAGDPVAAHREGARTSAAIYGVRVPDLADVVIANSRPMDSDLRQGVKALANTVRAVRPGGLQITLMRAEEGVGVFGLAARRIPLGPTALRLLAPLLLRVVPRLRLSGMGEEDRFFLYFALQVVRRTTQLVYAPTIPPAVRANLPFVSFVDDPAGAVREAHRRRPGRAEVLVFPYGGSTYPILE